MIIAYLGLGGNIGNSKQTLDFAIKVLNKHPLAKLIAISSYYLSAPINATGNDYINCVIKIEWKSSATQLLKTCLKIEKEFGRERSIKNAPRTLDVDILLFGNQKIEEKNLCIPHKEITNRAFVLLPLTELDSEIEIPEKGQAKNFLQEVSNQVIQKLEKVN